MKTKKTVFLFLKKFIVFLLPIMATVYFFEMHLPKVQNSVSKKYTIFERTPDAEVIVLGASHANHAINPTFLNKKTLNLANIGQDLYYDAEIAKKVLEKSNTIKTIIVTITYFSFDYRMVDRPDFWRSFSYTHVWNITNENPRLQLDPRSYSLLALYEPLNAITYAKKIFDIDFAPSIEKNGWNRADGIAFDLSDSAGEKLARLHTATLDKKYRKENEENLENLIKNAQKNNVKIILVTPPVFASYARHIDSQIYEYMQGATKEISEKYTTSYFNYLEDTRFVESDYSDVDHLNTQGAEKFSRIVNTEVLGNL